MNQKIPKVHGIHHPPNSFPPDWKLLLEYTHVGALMQLFGCIQNWSERVVISSLHLNGFCTRIFTNTHVHTALSARPILCNKVR